MEKGRDSVQAQVQDTDPKTARIMLRMSVVQKRLIRKKAAEKGLNMSEYIRRRALGEI